MIQTNLFNYYVRDTSIDSYRLLDSCSDEDFIIGLLKINSDGLTDFEISLFAKHSGREHLNPNRVASRRADVNKHYERNVIVNINGEVRVNMQTGKKALVWRVNKKQE